MKRSSICEPALLFIFGGTGDLTKRKLIPALYNLHTGNWLHRRFTIVCIGKSLGSREELVNSLKDGVKKYNKDGEKFTAAEWESFSKRIEYLKGDISSKELYDEVVQLSVDFIAKTPRATVIHYLAIPPSLFGQAATNLADTADEKTKSLFRLVIEKPFGTDLKTAKALNRSLLKNYKEHQLYRIDHYLGKETVQNIMAFRFANSVFEPVWNRNFIDSVQITAAESIGIEGRGGYYDKSGALRDMIQNHVLQIMCMIAMEPPADFEADEVRNKTRDVLMAVRKIKPAEVIEYAVRGQYSGGAVDGVEIDAYRKEKNVETKSNTETFAALKLFVDNWRWNGVPFYLRSGKRLAEKITQVVIEFKDVPNVAFGGQDIDLWKQNHLVINIQPEMNIRLQIQAKEPGPDMRLTPVEMVFDYQQAYGNNHVADAYQTLLQDVIEGDATLFMRADQVEEAWKVVMPVLNYWQDNLETGFPNYKPNSSGPGSSAKLLESEGDEWSPLTS